MTQSSTALLVDQLKQGGFKVTKSRLAVLRVLAATKQPLSVQTIIKRLSGSDADQATVYRMLTALTEANILRRIDFEHGHAHYELFDDQDHHHVVCTNCHRIEDVRDCNVSSMADQILKQSKFAEINRHSLEFFGLCQECKR